MKKKTLKVLLMAGIVASTLNVFAENDPTTELDQKVI